jgi:hypothetical protein
LANFRITTPTVGTNRAIDSDAPLPVPPSTISSFQTRGDGTKIDLTYDIGLIALNNIVSIGDFVWFDTNRDGLQTAGEPGVVDVTVTLRDSNGNTMSTVTNSMGLYLFSSTSPGSILQASSSYIIEISLATGPLVGYQATLPFVGSNTNIDSNGQHLNNVTVSCTAASGSLGTSITSYDFGFIPIFYIGDFIWSDNNANGLQDAGEAGISGVTGTSVAS